jgi:hypothetical protein
MESTELPTRLVARTVKVYVVPLVNASTVQLVVEVVQMAPPGFAVTRYCVMTAPFSLDAFHETTA